MIRQIGFTFSAKHRGCHLITREVLAQLPQPLPKAGLLNLFVKHTSCALSINENADPDVLPLVRNPKELGIWSNDYFVQLAGMMKISQE